LKLYRLCPILAKILSTNDRGTSRLSMENRNPGSANSALCLKPLVRKLITRLTSKGFTIEALLSHNRIPSDTSQVLDEYGYPQYHEEQEDEAIGEDPNYEPLQTINEEPVFDRDDLV